MAFISLSDSLGSRRGGAHLPSDKAMLSILTTTKKISKEKQCEFTIIRFRSILMAELGWMSGDSIDIKVDPETCECLIVRLPAGKKGWKLQSTTANNGKSVTCTCKIVPDRGVPVAIKRGTDPVDLSDCYKVTKEGLFVKLPASVELMGIPRPKNFTLRKNSLDLLSA